MFLYEEFMARSSTRMALQKGGNYMGMMNVLMQLRKVCNHPDLFEPRSIITPFFSERLSISTAGCVAAAATIKSPFGCVSPHFVSPLWSIGTGMPSFDNSIKHDKLISSQLKELQPSCQDLIFEFDDTDIKEHVGTNDLNPGLRRFLSSIWDESKTEKKHVAQFQASINKHRCEENCFLLPTPTLEAVSIDPKIPSERKYNDLDYFRVASTPKELLAMKKSHEEREHDMEDIMSHFLFYVPKAGARVPMIYAQSLDSKILSEDSPLALTLSKEIEANHPSMRKSNAPFFPDKKLVQFDAGKLQTLAELCRSLKQGNHRVLIFTQMSKMLDILEIFLNLNGHTYLRLDGSTGVEQRQRLMDRFNTDERIFCFILSTRSGGLGINLTGADTVVFYDSDWNPAMDAQAQDRAHRIGQTRDVHIYRLVTQHTIEENILVKAKQKRHLDFLVMDEGNFHAAEPAKIEEENDTECDVTSKTGLRSILGLESDDAKSMSLENEVKTVAGVEMSKEEMELAMEKLEDEDDVMAMRGAQKEAAEELQEFDEAIKVKTDDTDIDENESQDSQEDGCNQNKESNVDANKNNPNEGESEEAKLEKEFADWQRQVGADKASIDASLNPVERYALRFREDIDPFYSMWYLSEQQRIQEAEMLEDEFDIEEIEAMKAAEEQSAIQDGDLLATSPLTTDLPFQRNLYHQEKSRIKANKKRRKLTGENWSTKIDGRTKFPFWYNSDTGEAVWDKPKILIELHEEEVAQQYLWNAIPMKPLIAIMKFLLPYPDRMICASVCRQWRLAAQDISFVRHVYPVEMGALTMDQMKMENNHYRTISEALLEVLPGDTIGRFLCYFLFNHFNNQTQILTLQFHSIRTWRRALLVERSRASY
jgi:superfamily II DNA/RNA helicase